ncbi:type I glyceraldehyde-3-phosphate dehydrogenase [Zymomonas mobilis subsp. mobilis ZM4 = ATCC 31821]|uniref:Glyceraldehyde-3-phosphate dehydrogenase n=3 Tax=Zymomonas mobilis TaxID=542 RepID=G3P_ZYMMO|nr:MULTISPECIES: type I glyceraldehyde-3-phosphate dehydrogenase [Zymomonas]P09316.1 RecName: Full=Glyceraldehyde-3-phosphate dehydrogenase; Short=GAPDH; AltName: Full=NAD-dependent glyceraldehyde-3-phosphate dehydrogenase [Zymomonas mobilis subsp. mobilis ZM4 = ATCC 31821]AAA27688.1 glyceraldehyde-3-phosphate dehydrogenase [Zymomonas mobilis]AAV88801.1 glyceraldehyde-3-phosphate dehydrogenase, type I [Zymomonas mobilis subsp. mobilis ZM4 = ATCC 31821]ACV75577.1 glyceraldehyde-3-phosphate dehyd
MAVKVAINGFGRIGRLAARAILSRPDSGLELVTINDLGSVEGNAFLFKRDSAHGTYPGTVTTEGNDMVIDGKKIVVTAERDPANLPHKKLGVDIVMECTGIFTNTEKASAHLTAGAKKVLISAPAKGDVDRTVVYGVNHKDLTADDKIVSNASCTTNCLAPVLHVLQQKIGIVRGLMTTVHSFTNDQRILDQIHSDLRRARTASASMIPTSTGAARAVALVIPELKGKLDGISIRVPTPDVSLVDFTFVPQRDTTAEEINSVLKAAADTGDMTGVLGYTDEPLVSRDFYSDPHSSTVDSRETAVLEGKLARVVAWYDNEWGFSNRMVDTAAQMAKTL